MKSRLDSDVKSPQTFDLDALKKEALVHDDPYWDGSDDWVPVNRANLWMAIEEVERLRAAQLAEKEAEIEGWKRRAEEAEASRDLQLQIRRRVEAENKRLKERG